MKFTVQMKDPDTLSDAIDEAVEAVFDAMPDLSAEEQEAAAGVRKEQVRSLCYKWFEYGEYLRVEIDTEAGTCTVLAR